MMNVSSWSIKNPLPSILLFILLTLMGVMSFRAMKIQNYPDFDLPTVIVTARLPGASPGQMETEVARKIENSVATLQLVKHIYTLVQEGSATISVEFRLEKPPSDAVDDVRDAVSRIRSDLPGDLLDPVIAKMDLAGLPIITYTMSSKHLDDEGLSWFVDNTVNKAILSVKGVGAVDRVGGVTRQIQVEIDPDRLMALHATASDVSRQLRQVEQEAPGGRADVGGMEQSIRMIGTVKSAAELAKLDIPLSDGRHIRLDQVATVKDAVAERRSAALLNGRPVVGFEITRSRGSGEVEVGRGVRAEVARLAAKYPDVTFTEAFNFVDSVQENYYGSMTLLYEGAILAVIVVWFFLRDVRATIISATALPLSIVPAFSAMHILGFSINVVTLLSLSLVVGILVDDAIVEIENIMRHLRMGKKPYQAAMDAADEIGLAVIATTFSLIAVFLPTAFMSGVVGKFFVQFGWTASIAVFFSLVVARMLTPMMAAYVLKPFVKEHHEPHWMDRYGRWAAWCLDHRLTTSVMVALGFFGSFMLLPLLPTGFMPADDLSQTMVSLELQPGSTFKRTYAMAEQARKVLEKNRYVKMVYTAVGGGRSGGNPFAVQGISEVRKANLTLTLTPRDQRRGVTKQQIESQLLHSLEVLPGVRIKVGLGGEKKYELVLASENGHVLNDYAAKVAHELRTVPGIGSVTYSSSLVRPELRVYPDFARAAELGVTSAAIADTLRIATAGDFDQDLAKLNLSQRQVPIMVKLRPDARRDVKVLKRLAVPGTHGPVMLGDVARMVIDSGPSEIDRYDRLRNVKLEIELNGREMGEVENQVFALPTLKNLPPGIRVAPVGEAEAMGELFSGFGLAIATGVFCIYIVLVLLFRDFVQPVSILAALFLSIPGAFIGLFLTRTALSMPAMIGLIMLMGIATKNSILLVEYALMARREFGLERREALLDACMKRARPIVMTTIAMGAGMLPIALGLGNDPSFRAPMAIVVIFGLITSTFLSLLVIPVVFTYVDDMVQWSYRHLRKGSLYEKRHRLQAGGPPSS